jgi:hypothetical protein
LLFTGAGGKGREAAWMAAMDRDPPPPPTAPQSKASRAYIAGLGTTGILIASFLLTLVIVSASW